MSKVVEFGPKSKKQEDFLNTTADICVFGGGAGSGKSYLGVMDLLRHCNDPRFRGVVVRRLTPQLKGPGGIFETACNLYREALPDKVKIRDRDMEILFETGAEVIFRHCQHVQDKYNFQGWQISAALIDEAQQLEYEQVVYIMSRLRTDANMKPYMRMTCNPDKNSWLRDWVDWYLQDDCGIPDESKSGVLRWFIMQDNQPMWANSKEEIYELYGASVNPLSFTFINANVYDNPVMMERQPDYVAWLEGLPRVEKARLLYGDWDATETAAGYWKKEWIEEVYTAPVRVKKRVRAWDLAATKPSEVMPNPDWTCGVLMSRGIDDNYYVEDVVRLRERFADVEEAIFKTAERDGTDVTIVIPVDAGAAGKAYSGDLARRLADKGYYVRTKRPSKSKVIRFGPFATVSEQGFVKVVHADWNSNYYDELENFTGDNKRKDDQVDATADAYWGLKSGVDLPSFTLPDWSKQNEFAI